MELPDYMPFVRQRADEARKSGLKERSSRCARARVEIESIKEKMVAGLLAGYSPKSLREALHLPRSTWDRYHKELADETYRERLKDTHGLLHNYFTRSEQLFREAMEAYNAPVLGTDGKPLKGLDGKAVRKRDPRYLAQASDVLGEMFKNLQSAGFLPKGKEVLHVKGSFEMGEMLTKLRKEREARERGGVRKPGS